MDVQEAELEVLRDYVQQSAASVQNTSKTSAGDRPSETEPRVVMCACMCICPPVFWTVSDRGDRQPFVLRSILFDFNNCGDADRFWRIRDCSGRHLALRRILQNTHVMSRFCVK